MTAQTALTKHEKPRATPYHCRLCPTEKGCGFHGILRFPNAEVPTCDHHIEPGVYEEPVPMVPAVPHG